MPPASERKHNAEYFTKLHRVTAALLCILTWNQPAVFADSDAILSDDEIATRASIRLTTQPELARPVKTVPWPKAEGAERIEWLTKNDLMASIPADWKPVRQQTSGKVPTEPTRWIATPFGREYTLVGLDRDSEPAPVFNRSTVALARHWGFADADTLARLFAKTDLAIAQQLIDSRPALSPEARPSARRIALLLQDNLLNASVWTERHESDALTVLVAHRHEKGVETGKNATLSVYDRKSERLVSFIIVGTKAEGATIEQTRAVVTEIVAGLKPTSKK